MLTYQMRQNGRHDVHQQTHDTALRHMPQEQLAQDEPDSSHSTMYTVSKNPNPSAHITDGVRTANAEGSWRKIDDEEESLKECLWLYSIGR
ncbi:uncharacterized protein L203_102277 [Cryptococcus depauperatus CBS 7841]|uniref:Uncharacterized protein n=1 Tax=Cryptococcus depauperatus CBS 7841 TaxID=1295531 RepID=A0AAJ8JRM9_9TREE